MTGVRRLRVSVTDAAGRRVSRGPAAGLGAWLARHAPATARGDVAIAIVSDTDMRRLNRVHRGVDHVTDVLSFRSGSRVRGFSGSRVGSSGSGSSRRRPGNPDLSDPIE